MRAAPWSAVYQVGGGGYGSRGGRRCTGSHPKSKVPVAEGGNPPDDRLLAPGCSRDRERATTATMTRRRERLTFAPHNEGPRAGPRRILIQEGSPLSLWLTRLSHLLTFKFLQPCPCCPKSAAVNTRFPSQGFKGECGPVSP